MIQRSIESQDESDDLLPPTSGFVAACPRLTELTVISPHPHDSHRRETGALTDPVGSARSAASELVNACKALPDFDTFQIAHFPFVTLFPKCPCGWFLCGGSSIGTREPRAEQNQISGIKAVKDSVIDCLKPKAECQEGEGRKKIMLRIIELDSERRSPYYLGSVKVEEYEV